MSADEVTRDLAREPLYFPVSILKLVVLVVFSFGLYQIYWFFQNWLIVKRRENANFRAAWRTVFPIIFAYFLFRRMHHDAQRLGIRPRLYPGPSAAAYLILSIASELPHPLFLAGLLAPAILLPIQLVVNRINTAVAPQHDTNDRFTAANWLWVVGGSVALLLVIAGLFLPDPLRHRY